MIVEKKPLPKETHNELAKGLHLSLLRQGHFLYLNAWGKSMYPFIKSGDRIKIEPVGIAGVKIGDIVAVDRQDNQGAWFSSHRVVKIIGNHGNKIYFTKGDFHIDGLDKPVPEKLIVGKITEITRRNLNIRLESFLYRYLNVIIAKLSFRHPKILHFLARYLSLAIEWRLFWFKLESRLAKTPPFLRNAETLLLLCARKELNEAIEKRAAELIREGLDWGHFCECAIRGGVTVLVYNSLKRIEFYTYIPAFVFERLKSAYLYIVAKTTFLHKELMEVLGLFAGKDIPVIPFKGPLLSERLYGDIAAHGLSVDIDLFIGENDKESSRILLESAGYSYSPNLTAIQSQYEFTKHNATPIDLHWDIMMRLGSQERKNDLWKGARLRYEERVGLRYYELKEEELLFYLSSHLTSSCSFRWTRYICDINELLSKYKNMLDWESIIKKAQKWSLSGSLYLALRLSRDFFNADVDRGILKKLRPHFFASILIRIFANKRVIFHEGRRRRLIDGLLAYVFRDLIEARSLKEYLYIFKRIFFPPKEAMNNRSYVGRIFNIILRAVKIIQPLSPS